MPAKKRIWFFVILLWLFLVFASCVTSGDLNENQKTDNTAASSGTQDINYEAEHEKNGKRPDEIPQIDQGDNKVTPLPDETPQNTSEDNKPEEILKINGLVQVQDIDPDIVVELKYATTDNFTGQKVYPNEICVLQESTAEKLANANRELMEMGYRIKVWDAYRPVYVQQIFWDIVPDSRYVANPNNGGSKHNRGTAVDVTLLDIEGNELEMPSDFDDFTGKGSRNNKDLSESAQKNVDLLTDVMTRNGFTTISTEWWHYNDSDSDLYQVIDVNLEKFLQNNTSEGEQSINTDRIEDVAEIGNSQQIIIVVGDSDEKNKACVYTYEKVDGQWQQAFNPMDAVIASGGLTQDKKEGDKKSPIGVFPIYRCFGREENPGTKLSYIQFEKNDYWVDDVNSVYYNTYQKGYSNGRWNSAEDLYAIGEAYKYFIVIEYNTAKPVAGKGSAIFLHVWKGKDSSTSGCTAVSEKNLLKIMRWLNPSKEPLLIQGDGGWA